MIDKIIDATTCGVLFIVGAVLVSFNYAIPKKAEFAMAVGGIIFLGLTFLFYYRMLQNKHFFLKIFHFFGLDKSKNPIINKIEKAIIHIELIMIQFYKEDKVTFLLSVFITLLSWVVMFIEYKLATMLLDSILVLFSSSLLSHLLALLCFSQFQWQLACLKLAKSRHLPQLG